jgi:hypothetical protein
MAINLQISIEVCWGRDMIADGAPFLLTCCDLAVANIW